MKKRYMLVQRLIASFLFASLFLQSCTNFNNYVKSDVEPDSGFNFDSDFDFDEEELGLINRPAAHHTYVIEKGIISDAVTVYQSTVKVADEATEEAIYHTPTIQAVSIHDQGQEISSRASCAVLAESEKEVVNIINRQKASLVRFMQRRKQRGPASIEGKELSIRNNGNALTLEKPFKVALWDELPENYELGETNDEGDCFFDALAQCLNKINNTHLHNVKTLRSICHSFYLANKNLVNRWNKVEEYGGMEAAKGDEYMMVQYTVEECKKDFHNRIAIFGRPHVEGLILARTEGLIERGILFISVLKDLATGHPTLSFTWVQQGNGLKRIGVEKAHELLLTKRIPTLVNVGNSKHYVPLLPISSENRLVKSIENLDKGKEELDEGIEDSVPSLIESEAVLPYEIWAKILSYVPLEEIYKYKQVNRTFDGAIKFLLKQNLRRAIIARELNDVCRLLLLGVDPNTYYRNGITPLRLAAERDDVETEENIKMIRLLILGGANIHAKDENGLNAIYRAAKAGHWHIVKGLMYKYGAIYPLHDAIEEGNIERIEQLIAGGADVNFKDKYKNTALHLAIKQVNILLNKHLADKGLSLNLSDFRTESPQYETIKTIKQHYVRVVHTLLLNKETDINARNIHGQTPLYTAAQEGYVEMVNLLIDKGADIDASNSMGNSPFYAATEQGHVEVVNLLIDKGVNINAMNNMGNYPLHCAVEKGHLDVVNRLIDKGADINAMNNMGNSPLHCAAFGGQLKVVKFLIANKADIHITNEEGETALYSAVEAGDRDIVSLLLDQGADIKVLNIYNDSLLHLSIPRNYIELAKLLINRGADINAKDDSGYSPLHWAIQKGSKELVELLIIRGADPNAKDNNGLSPIQIAMHEGYTELAELLTKKPTKQKL